MKTYKNFISFEGIDFSGKTTQIQLLLNRLTSCLIRPILVREPGGTPISEKIREILLNTDYSEMNKKTELLLYEAARAQLVHEKIIPLLEKGDYVIADRFYDSTTAYQGYGRRLDLKTVHTINRFATSQLQPYVTFFIDIAPQQAEERQLSNRYQKDRLEKGGLDFFNQIRDGFLKISKTEPERFLIIKGDRAPLEISEEIWKTIRRIWKIKEVK
jgi:dTMP kinase